MREKRQKENDLKKIWEDFQTVQTKISTHLLNRQGELEELKLRVKKCEDFPVVLKKIEKLEASPVPKEDLVSLGK